MNTTIMQAHEDIELDIDRGIEPSNTAHDQHFAYVVGRIDASFPSLSVEKAFYQSLPSYFPAYQTIKNINDQVALEEFGQSDQAPTDLYEVLSLPQNRYIAREMIWTLVQSEKSAIYTLLPSSLQDLDLLVAALGPEKSSNDPNPDDVVITGRVVANTNSTRELLISNIKPTGISRIAAALIALDPSKSYNQDKLISVIREIYSANKNAGITAADRALNYALGNNLNVYSNTYGLLYNANSGGANPNGYQLSAINVQKTLDPSRDSYNVIFSYQGINTGATQHWYSEIDVTGEFPFITIPWARFLPLK